MFFGRSLYSGKVSDKAKSLNEFSCCAHTMDIVFRCEASAVSSPTTSDFFLLHHKYNDPVATIVQDPSVSLMNIDSQRAIFCKTRKGFNVHDPKHGPFFYHVQYKHCTQVITIPLHFLVQLANKIPPSKPLSNRGTRVVLHNTGRCGSTLLIKILQKLPNVSGISEPDALWRVMESKYSFEERAKLLGAVISLQCKDFSENVIIKPRGQAVYCMAEQSVGSPDTKMVFMYRDPIQTIASFCGLFHKLPKLVIRIFLPKLMRMTIQRTRNLYNFNHALLTSRLQKAMQDWDLVEFNTLTFLAGIAAYRHAKQRMGTAKIYVIKYEHVLQDPIQEIKQLLKFCNIQASPEDLNKCLEAMDTDSQAGSVIGRQKVSENQVPKSDFAALYTHQVNETFQLFGFPPAHDFDNVFS